MTHGDGLELAAPAKVNLGLHVLARRGDGYHEIDTVLAKLELADTLVVQPAAEGVSGEVTAPEGPGFDTPLAMDENNLAVRAARLYLEAAGARGGVRIRLEKRVPIAAGLGGGSSDAAAALRGVARLYPAEVDLAPLALEIGSDVPFFLEGSPAARGRGRGERLTPVDLPAVPLVLVNPGVAVSAAEAYAALQNFTSRLDVEAIVARLQRGEDPGARNALQPGVMLAHPPVREALLAVREAGLSGACMSGSGATCFGVAASRDDARRVATEIAADRPGWWVAATAVRGV